jgi:hypothetical protein
MNARALRRLAVVTLCLALAAQACIRKVDGVWVESLSGGRQRLWFAKRGFFVTVPASWHTEPPNPPMRAMIRRKTQDGFTITCSFQVFTDPAYRGVKPEELLDRFFGPESLTGALKDDPSVSDVRFLRTDRISVAGHPANHFLYTIVATTKGISAPLEMSALTVPYKSVIFTSYCGSLVEDFPSLEAEFASIQRSLRRFGEQ